jgi:hypothetical protein
MDITTSSSMVDVVVVTVFIVGFSLMSVDASRGAVGQIR